MSFANHLSKLTYLFCLLTERFGTFNPAFARLGCQGFNGRVPLPFLISLKKNCYKDNKLLFDYFYALKKIMNGFIKTISNPKFIFILFLVLVIAATLQSLLLTKPNPGPDEWPYTFYNNYIIFKQSFFHLINKQDLYAPYRQEYWDLYKYSPAFALFFGSLSVLPDAIGLFLWNLLNAFVLFIAIYKLPKMEIKYKSLILLTVCIEVLTAMQNSQSNGLMVGLLILAFCMLEQENYLLAALFISLTIFIKVFGLVACVLFIFYPKKTRATLYMFGWCLLFALIPGFFVGFEQLIFLYKSWLNMLANDHSISNGYSVIGWLKTWFNIEPNKLLVLLVGLILLLLPLLKIKNYKDYSFRLTLLASILIWIVIFNHRAESPTFVIAITGVAIWFYNQNPKKENIVLLVLAIVFTCLSPTDLFPKYIRQNFLEVYVIKALPCILIWLKISYDLLFDKLKNPNLIK